VAVFVNGACALLGKPGTYAEIRRSWQAGDKISFNLPLSIHFKQYTGFDQAEGNCDRYAALYGPVLLALTETGTDAGTDADTGTTEGTGACADTGTTEGTGTDADTGTTEGTGACADTGTAEGCAALGPAAAEKGFIPRLATDIQSLEGQLEQHPDLSFTIKGFPQYRYMPYFAIQEEAFTCFPIIEGIR